MKRKRTSRLRKEIADFWNEFKQVKFGIAGIVLLILFISLVIFEQLLIPFPEASTRWRDITYWEDNPRSVPPVWINWFSTKDYAPTEYIRNLKYSERNISSSMIIMESIVEYNYNYDIPPVDIIYRGKFKGNIMVNIVLERPDGTKINLMSKSYSSQTIKDFRISIVNESKSAIQSFARRYVPTLPARVDVNHVLFSQANSNLFIASTPLKGLYKFHVSMVRTTKDTVVEDTRFVISGSVSGFLGTDSSKRDIWSGLVAGVKWALFIGLLTSAISVSVGVIYGVVSAYYGGIVDSIMQRIWEVFINIPLLPVLIVLSAIFKPSIWNLIVMMSLFFWVGPVKTVRSMALQIKEETYVEAARALGASHGRIIFRHMIPILIPYAFASMALNVPSAILYEATVSLLGLGDATIVTWGQILHDAMSGGAVTNGLWWWVVPPGVAIALVGMTFAFLGFAMDTILNPKLRTR
jgi:peptide/nickel transport system permease protein